MPLINIEEPQNQSIHSSEIVVGIDFGTTNSLVAHSINSKPYVIPNSQGLNKLPSIVSFNHEGNVISIGSKEKHYIAITSVKRLLGKSTEEILNSNTIGQEIKELLVKNTNITNLKIADKTISPIEISARIINQLKLQAEQYFNQKIKKAVISVPAHFDDTARNSIKQAAIIADLEVLRLISEPTAAAYSYGLDKGSNGVYLVYDFGGGTFDVSLLKIKNKIFQVIATGGDNQLGGNDIDYLIRDYLCNKLTLNQDHLSTEFLVLITEHCKIAKEHLTNNEFFNQTIKYNGKNLKLHITRTEFEQVISNIISQTIHITNQVIEESKVSEQLKGIILVGGSSNIPLIKKLLKQTFKVQILSDLNPETVVATGAALQAENLTSSNQHLLIDVVPLSLGLEVMGGITEILIPRNSPIPIAITKKFTTYANNQTAINFHIVQGEREMAANCRSLAKFTLSNLPLGPAGSVSVEVTFAIDVDGLLFVSTSEQRTGIFEFVTIKSALNISREEVNENLENAYQNNLLDYNKKQLHEAITKANFMISNIKQLIAQNTNLISTDNMNLIENVIQHLQKSVKSDHISAIQEGIKQLEDFKSFLLNSSLKLALQGKNIDKLLNNKLK
ncbi:hsp70 family protein [Orientia tsutsugamushi str. Gilliam]|uniref:Hsp70 family protein n=1 Tax=Orientia tsutsugamushi str. Gilliam TaxID=1359184 RepID=A0A0F3MEG8_ORITS|nr:Fe-S protein assembly chaperone HscA [Orientia tsutsugamushi]KJV53882.1 hsp70 family protein [Orientia tsutsugamushi str. Gilliam]SPR08097.1 molecular chaperone HscA [Orientia tsutsugamushi str. Gilliam]